MKLFLLIVKTDAQCFSNKCLNNTCTFNIEANI